MNDINIPMRDELEAAVIASIEKKSSELMRLCNLVSDMAKIDIVNGRIVSDSLLSS